MRKRDLLPIEIEKLVEVVLYVLNKMGGSTLFFLSKTLYFAQKGHLSKYGIPIIQDHFLAWKHGPVPMRLNSVLNDKKQSQNELHKQIWSVIETGTNDAKPFFIPKREADLDWLTRSEIQALDNAIAYCKQRTFNEISSASHDEAWKKARAIGDNEIMSPIDIAGKIAEDSDVEDGIILSNGL